MLRTSRLRRFGLLGFELSLNHTLAEKLSLSDLCNVIVMQHVAGIGDYGDLAAIFRTHLIGHQRKSQGQRAFIRGHHESGMLARSQNTYHAMD